MAKSVKWQSMNQKHKTGAERSCVYQTDYDIPRFGYKSSFIILLSTLFTLFIVPLSCEYIGMDYRMPTIVLGGLAAGFSAVYTQFFIERKKGFTKHFWIVGGLLSLFSAMLIFVVVYAGIIM